MLKRMTQQLTVLCVLFTPFITQSVQAQDTLQISLDEFIERGLNNSGQVDYERQKIQLAENQVNQARSQRYLPQFELRTQHGTVPGVKSNRSDLEPDEYYLDPNLENDWENWAIFTRAEVSAVQPIFSWGALSNAVDAAQAGAEAAEYEFQSKQTDLELRLYELYYSYILAQEVNRLLEEAQDKIDDIQNALSESDTTDQSDVFKFQVYKSEFGMRAAEINENINYIRSVWDYVLQADSASVYMPSDQFLDPVANQIETMSYYKSQAMQNRAEIKGIEAGIEAAEHGIKATKAQNLPTFFIGLTGSYANTPNRPRQDNPFIINNTNYASAGIGFSIRQNLDFFSAKTDIQRREIQHRQAKFLKDAAVDGIMLEVSEKYKNASVSKANVDITDETLATSKKWLRLEQQEYDFGIGDTKDLIDAMKKELELRLQMKQRIFEFNKDMAELYKVSGLPLTTLKTSN